jgi:pimeloyl-ACP methyl ester carboxylesterase
MYATENFEKFRDQIQRSKDIASAIRDEGIVAVLNGMMARPSRVPVMEKGRIPGLWILGELDKIINAGSALKQVRLPANAKVAVLENSGHMGFIEEEESSANILTGFFSGIK